MKCSVQQKLFIYDTFVQRFSWRKWHRKFCRKYPESTVLCKTAVHSIIRKLHFSASMLDKSISWMRRTDWRKTCLEASPKKSLHLLALQCVLGKSAVNAGTKFLKLLPYKTATLRSFCLQTPKQEFVIVGGLRYLYPVVFLTQYLCFILMRRGSL
jgi:hypothetical protein